MKEVIFDGKVILDLEKILQSDSIAGIEMVGSDPGNLGDNILYLVSPNSGGNQELYIRYNTALYKIGEQVPSIGE